HAPNDAAAGPAAGWVGPQQSPWAGGAPAAWGPKGRPAIGEGPKAPPRAASGPSAPESIASEPPGAPGKPAPKVLARRSWLEEPRPYWAALRMLSSGEPPLSAVCWAACCK